MSEISIAFIVMNSGNKKGKFMVDNDLLCLCSRIHSATFLACLLTHLVMKLVSMAKILHTFPLSFLVIEHKIYLRHRCIQ